MNETIFISKNSDNTYNLVINYSDGYGYRFTYLKNVENNAFYSAGVLSSNIKKNENSNFEDCCIIKFNDYKILVVDRNGLYLINLENDTEGIYYPEYTKEYDFGFLIYNLFKLEDNKYIIFGSKHWNYYYYIIEYQVDEFIIIEYIFNAYGIGYIKSKYSNYIKADMIYYIYENNLFPVSSFYGLLFYPEVLTSNGKILSEYKLYNINYIFANKIGKYYLNCSGELYTYYDDNIYHTGLYPFGNVSQVIPTEFKDVFIVNDGIDNKVYTLSANLLILTKKSVLSNEDQDTNLYEYNIDLDYIYNTGLTQRNSYYTTNSNVNVNVSELSYNVDKYITVEPVGITLFNNNLYMCEKYGIYNLNDDFIKTGYIDIGHNDGNVINNKGNDGYVIKYNNNTSYIIDANNYQSFEYQNTIIKRVCNLYYYNYYICIDNNKRFYINEYYTYGITGIEDFDIVYYYIKREKVEEDIINVLNFGIIYRNDKNICFRHIKFYNGNIELSSETILLDNTEYNYIKCIRHDLNGLYNIARPSYIALYNTDQIDVYEYILRYDYINTPTIDKLELKTVIYKDDLLLNNGDIIDVIFRPKNFSIKINSILKTPVIPFFGFANNEENKILSGENELDIQLYTTPVLTNSFIPVDIINTPVFNPINYKLNSNTYSVWKYWLIYVMPVAGIESSVEFTRLLKGYIDSKGIFTIKGYTEIENNITNDVIEKRFSPDFLEDNVILYEALGNDNYPIYSVINSTDMATKVVDFVNSGSASFLKEVYIVDKETYIRVYVYNKSNFDGGVRILRDADDKRPEIMLNNNETYILQFYVKSDISQNIDVFVYREGGVNIEGMCLSTQASLTTEWQLFRFEFTVRFSSYYDNNNNIVNPYIIQFDLDKSQLNSNYYFKEIKIIRKDYFVADVEWELDVSKEYDIRDYLYFSNYGVYADYLNNSVYYTEGGLLYFDENNSVFIENPLRIVGSRNGIYCASKNKLYLLSGYDYESVIKTVVLNSGIGENNYHSLNSDGNFVVLYNDKGVFLITDEVRDIGRKISPYLYKDYRYSYTSAVGNMEIVIPIDMSQIEVLSVDAYGDSRDVSLKDAYAIYDIQKDCWYVYAYNSEKGNSFAYWDDNFDNFVCSIGGRLAVLEVDDYEFEQDFDYMNEDWDKILVNITSREMSLNQNTMIMKKIVSMVGNSITLRKDDGVNPDYFRLRIYELYNPMSPYNKPKKDIQKVSGYNYKNFNIKIDVNCYSMTFDLIVGRLIDSKNPKLVFKDLYIISQDIGRIKQGGY